MKRREKDLIDEIHEWRAELLAQHGNDLEQYVAHLQEREKEHPERVVSQIKVVHDDTNQ